MRQSAYARIPVTIDGTEHTVYYNLLIHDLVTRGGTVAGEGCGVQVVLERCQTVVDTAECHCVTCCPAKIERLLGLLHTHLVLPSTLHDVVSDLLESL